MQYVLNTIHGYLVDVEDAIRRMIGGVFLFFSEWLPRWIYEIIVSGIWPVMFRLARVSLLLCLWLSILFCLFLPGLVFKLAWWWKCGSMAWLVMAALGSYWGLKRIKARRKAARIPHLVPPSAGKKEAASVPVTDNKRKNPNAELLEDWPAD